MAWPTKTDFVDGDVLTAAQVNNIGTNLNLFNPTGATSGTVPVTDGSGGVTWSATGRVTLASGTITSGTFFDWTGISQNYTDLQLRLWDVRTSSTASSGFEFDCGGSTITSGQFQWWNNSADPVGNVAFNGDSGTTTTFNITWDTTTSNTSGNNYWEINFHNYSSTRQQKLITWEGMFLNPASRYFVIRGMASADVGSAVGIDKIRFNPGVTFTGTTYVLYGVK